MLLNTLQNMPELNQEEQKQDNISEPKNLVKIHPKVEAWGEKTHVKLHSWADRLKKVFDKLP